MNTLSRKKGLIRVSPKNRPPEHMQLSDIQYDLVRVQRSKSTGVTHYIYRSRRGGWLISFTDRQFIAGIENFPTGNTWGEA